MDPGFVRDMEEEINTPPPVLWSKIKSFHDKFSINQEIVCSDGLPRSLLELCITRNKGFGYQINKDSYIRVLERGGDIWKIMSISGLPFIVMVCIFYIVDFNIFEELPKILTIDSTRPVWRPQETFILLQMASEQIFDLLIKHPRISKFPPTSVKELKQIPLSNHKLIAFCDHYALNMTHEFFLYLKGFSSNTRAFCKELTQKKISDRFSVNNDWEQQ